MLRQIYDWETRLGYDVNLPTQDNDERPDAVGEILPDVLPLDDFGDFTEGLAKPKTGTVILSMQT